MPTVHASAVLVGARAVLIRGPSGSGKSSLARALIDSARSGRTAFARLVADDRVLLTPMHGRLLARAPEAIAGLVEMRGCGILAQPHEPQAVIGLVVDLHAADAARLPDDDARRVVLDGIALPRLPLAPGDDALAIVLRHCVWIGGPASPVAAPHQRRYP